MIPHMEHIKRINRQPPDKCPVCGRKIIKKEYWSVGSIHMRWYGDYRYDNEPGVFSITGAHPEIEERYVCADCFEAVMAALRARRVMNMEAEE